MRFVLVLLTTFGWCSAIAQTSNLTPRLKSEPIHVMVSMTTGEIQRQQRPQIQLPGNWDGATLVQTLKGLSVHSRKLTLKILTRQKNKDNHSERIAFVAFFQEHPVLDRDVIVIIKEDRRIDSINVNLPNVSSFGTVSIDNEAARQTVHRFLIERVGTSNLTLSTTPKRGWVALGDHLTPIAEYDVVDPVRLKHFTARVDLTSGQLLGFIERTIN